MRTHRRSGLLISNFALEKLFRYLINCAGVTRQNLVSTKSRFLSHSHDEGTCIQCMYIGPYDSEPETVTKMNEYMISEGYELDINEMRFHHEIYISDVRKTVPEKHKTVIRHPIKKKS